MSLELRGDYWRAEQLVALVAERVRMLHAAQLVTDRAARAALKANAGASERTAEAVGVLRDLAAALADSAGLSKPVDLATAVAAAEQLVNAEPEQLAI